MRPDVRSARFLEKLSDALRDALESEDEETLRMVVPAVQVSMDAFPWGGRWSRGRFVGVLP